MLLAHCNPSRAMERYRARASAELFSPPSISHAVRFNAIFSSLVFGWPLLPCVLGARESVAKRRTQATPPSSRGLGGPTVCAKWRHLAAAGRRPPAPSLPHPCSTSACPAICSPPPPHTPTLRGGCNHGFGSPTCQEKNNHEIRDLHNTLSPASLFSHALSRRLGEARPVEGRHATQ